MSGLPGRANPPFDSEVIVARYPQAPDFAEMPRPIGPNGRAHSELRHSNASLRSKPASIRNREAFAVETSVRTGEGSNCRRAGQLWKWVDLVLSESKPKCKPESKKLSIRLG
jgi:hypothetical protein